MNVPQSTQHPAHSQQREPSPELARVYDITSGKQLQPDLFHDPSKPVEVYDWSQENKVPIDGRNVMKGETPQFEREEHIGHAVMRGLGLTRLEGGSRKTGNNAEELARAVRKREKLQRNW